MENLGIDKLFRVTAKHEIEVRGKNTVVYLRTIGASDDAARNDYAVAKARQLLRNLRNASSTEAATYLDIDGTPAEDLVEQAISLKRPQFWRDAAATIHRESDPEPPDRPTITDIVEAEEETAKLDSSVNEQRVRAMTAAADDYRGLLQGMPYDTLVEEVRTLRTDSLLNAAFMRASNSYMLYASVYSDPKYRARYFNSPDEVAEASSDFTDDLLARYSELDGFAMKPEALKN